MRNNKKTKIKYILSSVFLLLLIILATGSYLAYNTILKPNLNIDGMTYFHIPTGSRFEDVEELLRKDNLLKNTQTFSWLASKKNYPNRVLPGRYLLKDNMGNNALINLLRSGKQEPVNITFNNIRTKQQLAGSISKHLETDSLSLIHLMNDDNYLDKFGMNRETVSLLFIPNTYEFFWNTSAEQVFERMFREYKQFWNDQRIDQAKGTGYSPEEIMIIASIVQSETTKVDEMSRIAGVYINRLKRNMRLQADPTVVFANGDFSLTRVLYSHLAIDSPYNTYLYAGLPPGPIALPEPNTIDRVLNHENHNYLYFCAKDDFSGYHVFSKTYNEHLSHARKYHRALTKQRSQRK